MASELATFHIHHPMENPSRLSPMIWNGTPLSICSAVDTV